MSTGLITHPSCLAHENGPLHPESKERLISVYEHLNTEVFQYLIRISAEPISRGILTLVHEEAYINKLERAESEKGHYIALDPDTSLGQGSLEAARHAAGAVITAIDAVMANHITNGFCAVRPPGHHALFDQAMGFCIFNNIALGAAHLMTSYNLKKIAIIDFDVHHGNGTEAYGKSHPEIFFCSSHQFPFWPGTGYPSDTGEFGNILNIPLPVGTGGSYLRARYETELLPALTKFQPEFILVSAGFDAHHEDPLGGLQLTENDFAWITEALCHVAETYAHGRLVSSLEGGYNLKALGKSVAAHVRALMAI